MVAGPDTDVHAWLENELQELQSIDAHNKLIERPHSVPSETPQGMIDNAVMLWELFDHSRSERSFKRNGLNNALSGEEDHLIDRTAKEFWDELCMRDRLNLVKCDVEAFIENKGGPSKVEAKHVFEIIQDYSAVPDGIGVMEEGQECEAALVNGEAVFNTDGADACAQESSDEEQPAGATNNNGQLVATSSENQPEADAKPCLGLPSRGTSDLETLNVLEVIAQKMNDTSVAASLSKRKNHLLRELRHQDPEVAHLAGELRDANQKHIKDMQAIAALEDDAKAQLKILAKKLRRPRAQAKAFGGKKRKLDAIQGDSGAKVGGGSVLAPIQDGATVNVKLQAALGGWWIRALHWIEMPGLGSPSRGVPVGYVRMEFKSFSPWLGMSFQRHFVLGPYVGGRASCSGFGGGSECNRARSPT